MSISRFWLMLIHLWMAYGCLWATRAQLRSCNTGHMASGVYYLLFGHLQKRLEEPCSSGWAFGTNPPCFWEKVLGHLLWGAGVKISSYKDNILIFPKETGSVFHVGPMFNQAPQKMLWVTISSIPPRMVGLAGSTQMQRESHHYIKCMP